MTDGFNWVSWLSTGAAREITNNSELDNKPFDILEEYQMNSTPFPPFNDTGVSQYHMTLFDEGVFLKPLAYFISQPGFFGNGTTDGVSFKTEIDMVYGKVSPVLAIAVVMLPIAWTLLLSLMSNGRKRWTASLDAFALFKLGGDWHGKLKDLRLASMKTAKKELGSIPGTVIVDAEKGIAELADPRKYAKVSKTLAGGTTEPLLSEVELTPTLLQRGIILLSGKLVGPIPFSERGN